MIRKYELPPDCFALQCSVAELLRSTDHFGMANFVRFWVSTKSWETVLKFGCFAKENCTDFRCYQYFDGLWVRKGISLVERGARLMFKQKASLWGFTKNNRISCKGVRDFQGIDHHPRMDWEPLKIGVKSGSCIPDRAIDVFWFLNFGGTL